MYVHIGGDIAIPIKSVIAMFDLDITTISKDTREFLKIAEEEGFIKSVNNELPKSFIITEKDKKSRIYLSPISTATLKKREGYIRSLSNINIDEYRRKNKQWIMIIQ